MGSDLRDVGLGESEHGSFDLDEVGINSEYVGPEPCNESIKILGDDDSHQGKEYYFMRLEILEYFGVQDLDVFSQKSCHLFGEVSW